MVVSEMKLRLDTFSNEKFKHHPLLQFFEKAKSKQKQDVRLNYYGNCNNVSYMKDHKTTDETIIKVQWWRGKWGCECLWDESKWTNLTTLPNNFTQHYHSIAKHSPTYYI